MKRTRKGFTLIELLIVIAVIGALAATMGTSTDKATAQAKAAAIVANVDACKTAAAMYYADYSNTNLATEDASKFLNATSEYIPSWSDFSGESVEGTKYTVDAEGKGYAGWAVTVDFSKDADATGIAKALHKIRGYTAVAENATSFKVTLASGKVEAASGSGSGSGSGEGGEGGGESTGG